MINNVAKYKKIEKLNLTIIVCSVVVFDCICYSKVCYPLHIYSNSNLFFTFSSVLTATSLT